MTPLDKAALRALATLTVRELALRDIPIDDAGLTSLGASPHLRRVRLTRSRVTTAGLAAFRAAHPAIILVDL